MGEKVALVLDTNFIYSNERQMEVLLQKLNESYEVYITQVSVDERKEQKCREFEKGYKNAQDFFSSYAYITEKPISVEMDKTLNRLRQGMQSKYEINFPGHIISYNASKELLEAVIHRANKKIPPFSANDNASDKGFKDALIWLSLLEYFKLNGENEVIFVSNDGGFRSEKDFLCQEFKECTGKSITIKDNSFYLKENNQEILQNKKNEIPPPDINQIREKLQGIINDLCGFYDVNIWGNHEWYQTFTLNERVDSNYIENAFNQLRQNITDNLFETSIPADIILGMDHRISNYTSIPMDSLEKALSFYEEIKEKLPIFLPQFYSAAANIINNNYIDPPTEKINSQKDDELPF